MIAHDSSSLKDWVSTGTTHTWAHTCTGNNMLLVLCGYEDGGPTLSSATYNGVAMDSMSILQYDGVIDGYSSIAALFIGTGDGSSHNIVATCSSPCNGAFVGSSYTGVKQSGLPDCTSGTFGGRASGGGVDTISVTTNSDGCWAIMSHRRIEDVVTGITLRQGTGLSFGCWDSNGPITPAGTITATFTSTARSGAAVMMAFAPVAPSVNGNMLACF